MKSIPPMGWGDLATKSDIATLDTTIDTKTAVLEEKIDTLGTVLAATFTAKLATEIGEDHKQIIGAVRESIRGQTVTLVVTLVVALFGQAVIARYLPPPLLPAPQVIIQSPGE